MFRWLAYFQMRSIAGLAILRIAAFSLVMMTVVDVHAFGFAGGHQHCLHQAQDHGAFVVGSDTAAAGEHALSELAGVRSSEGARPPEQAPHDWVDHGGFADCIHCFAFLTPAGALLHPPILHNGKYLRLTDRAPTRVLDRLERPPRLSA